MKKLKGSYLVRSLKTYILICLGCMLLSLIGLFFGDYYILVSLAIASCCGLLNLFLLIKSSDILNPQPEADNKGSVALMVGGNFLRFIMMLLAIGGSALVIYLTKTDETSKFTYLNIIAAGVPFIIMAITTTLVKPDDEIVNTENKVDDKTTNQE